MPEAIEVSYFGHSSLVITPEMAAQIDELWQEILANAARKNKRIWNGISCRVRDVETISDGKLVIGLEPIDFKTRECLIQFPDYWSWPEKQWRKGATAMVFVKTIDDYYVFVELSGRSLNERKYEMLGGIVGDTVDVRSGADLYEVIYKEMEEEAAISREYITSCVLRLVFVTPRTQIGFCFMAKINQTKAQVEVNYNMHGVDPDIKSLLFAPILGLKDQCESMGDYKPFIYQELFK